LNNENSLCKNQNRFPNRFLIYYGRQLLNVAIEIIVTMGGRGVQSFFKRTPFNSFKPFLQKLVRFCFDPIGNTAVRWAIMWLVIFKAAVIGRLMRRRDETERACVSVPRNNRPQFSVKTNRLTDGKDMPLVKGFIEG
jgi:hypothetical protein